MTSVKLINHSSSTADWNYYEVNEAGMLSELQLLPTDSNHKKLVNLISKKPFNQCTTGK